MKIQLRQLLWILMLLLACVVSSAAQTDYQKAIKSAYMEDLMMKKGLIVLKDLHKQLEELAKDKSIPQLNYWLCYDEYYMAMYYENEGEGEIAESFFEKGINKLEALNNKSSEDYALLALFQYSYIKYTSLGRVALAKRMAKNCQQAIDLDKNNIRAYVVSGMIDLARPRIFGGGKVGESYLLKALDEMSEQSIQSKLLPSWGKEEAYEALIRYYIEVGRKDEARDFLAVLKELYPANLQHDSLKAKL